MAFINPETKRLHCKVVYYGPSLGGKTTNIRWVYQKTTAGDRSDLVEFSANSDRTVLYDFLPMGGGKYHDLTTRLHLFSVPGQVVYDASRKLILKAVDGVIFVADSQLERMDENIEALRNLEKNLEQQGYDIRQLPMAIQYNKRDLPNAASLAELRAALNRYNSPDFEATASIGRGVFETLTPITKAIITNLKGGDV